MKIDKEQLITLLQNTFYPLEYGRWQADELFEEIIATIKAANE